MSLSVLSCPIWSSTFGQVMNPGMKGGEAERLLKSWDGKGIISRFSLPRVSIIRAPLSTGVPWWGISPNEPSIRSIDLLALAEGCCEELKHYFTYIKWVYSHVKYSNKSYPITEHEISVIEIEWCRRSFPIQNVSSDSTINDQAIVRYDTDFKRRSVRNRAIQRNSSVNI